MLKKRNNKEIEIINELHELYSTAIKDVAIDINSTITINVIINKLYID